MIREEHRGARDRGLHRGATSGRAAAVVTATATGRDGTDEAGAAAATGAIQRLSGRGTGAGAGVAIAGGPDPLLHVGSAGIEARDEQAAAGAAVAIAGRQALKGPQLAAKRGRTGARAGAVIAGGTGHLLLESSSAQSQRSEERAEGGTG